MKFLFYLLLFLFIPVLSSAQEGIDPDDILVFEDVRILIDRSVEIDQPYNILEYNIMIKPDESSLKIANLDFYESEEEQAQYFELLQGLKPGKRVWFDSIKLDLEDGTRKTISLSYKMGDDGLLYPYIKENE